MYATAICSSNCSAGSSTATPSTSSLAEPPAYDRQSQALDQASERMWILSAAGLADCQASFGAHEQQQQLYVNLSTFWYCFLALITAIGLLISLISNMIIIYLFTSNPFLRKNPSNIIAVNLSLSDLLYCVQWPSVIYCSLTQSTWILEHSFVCQSFGFITVSTAAASILTVLAMSIERAIVIIYSIHARNKFTIRLAWMIIVLIWIVSLSSCLPPLFGKFNRYTLDPSKTSCTLDYLSRQANYKLYILVLYVAYWIVPAILISISYITIIITFKKSSLDLKRISGETYASSSTSGLLAFQSKHLGKKLRNSFRLRYPTLNSNLAALRSESTCVRRASLSVLDLRPSSAFSQLGGCEQIPTTSMKELNNTNRIFRRGISSSMLIGRNHQTNSNNQFHLIGQHLDTGGVATLTGNQPTTRGEDTCIPSQIARWRSTNLSQKSKANLLFKPRIIKTLSSIKSIPQQTNNSQMTRTFLQFRLAKMSFYLILLWLVSWTPIASLAMVNSVMKCPQASAMAVFLASTMTKLGPALDVFVYGISHPRIKCKFKQIIRRLLFLDGACSISKLQDSQDDLP